jgi:hypothetical protein
MLKFFRKIRQGLISNTATNGESNRFSKYLLYAIGEIVLVVIGILIALQINTWNEARKSKELELNVLAEISQNLGEDIISLENDVNLNEGAIKNVQAIKNALALNQPMTDSLQRRFGLITFNATYTLKWSGYKNLSNIGFHILTQDAIRESITNLYETHYSFIKEREAGAKKITYEYVAPRYLEYFKEIKIGESVGGSIQPKIYVPENFETLENDLEFRRLLDYTKQIKYDNLYDLQLTLKQIRDTKKMIDTYLRDNDFETHLNN